ncbi:MAG: carboxymuconolactone decarboxylase family protein [Dehalococcoidia bacterium]|nr:carboxymuconolactone decarboxylase family protein [Dehalococcoidia bacterium]MDP7240165.1 carboxymuconolactone decarboxylase family protein [Dehalococcoidia bacterium]MDP7469200.1 carboxymuconolactone decarboxylase family protein [Dehalococcoidia bacterium]
MDKVEERMAKAKAKMEELFGPGGFERKGPLFEMAPPEFGDFTRETIFGTIWADDTLDVKYRSIATMSALIVTGKHRELRFHLRAALRLGFTKEQLIALICHFAFYAGIPVALDALYTAKEVFDRWDPNHPKAKSSKS